MAGSSAKPSVGSVSWIANERSTVQQLGDQDMEDFAFAARNDLEWLNEHMAEIFERNNLDVAELLKTPGKLRGQKTPKPGRKQVRPAAPGREPANENPSDNPFYTVAPLPGKKQTSPARSSSKSPSRPLRVLQDAKVKKPISPVKDNSFGPEQPEGQSSLTDSGIWSDFQSQPQQTGLISEGGSFVLETAIDSQAGDRSSNYHIAPEEPEHEHEHEHDREREREEREQEQEDEEQEEAVVEMEPEKPEDNDLEPPNPDSPAHTIKVASPDIITSERPATPQISSNPAALPKKAANKNEPEPRRSGRLARRSSPPPATVEAQPDRPNPSLPPPSLPSIPQQEASTERIEEVLAMPTEKSPTPPLAAVESVRPQTPSLEKTAESVKNSPTAQTPGDEDSSHSSSSESPAPEIPMARKSILNFASLPAREPLTNKKKSLGLKHTRDSNVEQVRLNGTSRASWMNRKGNGKSLGASSRQIERIEKTDKEAGEVEMKDTDEEEVILESDASNNLKRKSETVRDGSRKKSKGTSEESELEGDESNGETAKAVALHNKTSTQRLHDKIQQLGKVNASREARSFPSADPSFAYPELPQIDKEPIQTISTSKSTESEKDQSSSITAIGQIGVAEDEEEWIPMPKQTLTRSQSQKEEVTPKDQALARSQSHTEGTVASKQQESEKPVSARWRHHSPQSTSPQSISVRTITTSESAPNLRSPATVRQLPLSPLKASFSEDWIKAPALPAAKPSGEGAITAVKAHTSSVFKKAKEMLLKSSAASTSAKIETMNPASRSWQGGQNSQEQSKSNDSQESSKPMEQLYPDLGAMMAKDIDRPSSTKTPATESLNETRQMSIDVPEAVVESNREPRRTRSSASKDTPENSPKVEQLAVKIQKTRAEKDSDRLEEDEEVRKRLRQAEEELRRQVEKRELERKQQEEKLRKQREESESLRLTEEKLRQAQELQQKHKEEQMRKEKEGSKRLQEEKLKQEKEELKRRQQEELKKQKEEAQRAKEAPNSFHDENDSTDKEQDEDNEDDNASEADTRTMIRSSAEPERPPSRLQKAGSIRFQKTRDTKPVQRPGSAMKDHPKPKGPPVSISVGTASQREMQNQRNKPQAPTTSTLVAALKQSFENPSLMTSTSQTSLNSSTSNTSLRSSNLGGPSKPLKSLAAAASQLKKEQEDKERKLVAKREIERRKLENQRKMDDEARRARQKPASTQKTLARTPAVANLRQTSEEPERRLDFKAGVKPGLAKTAVKRAFQQDAAEEQQQYRQAATKSGAPSYQQDAAKKRRTGEYDERGERAYSVAPPLRQSVAKKETVPKSAMPHGYTQAPTSGMPSMLRPPAKHGVPMPQVEGVKFSKEKIRFADDSSTASTSTTPSAFKTPGSKSAKPSKTPAGAKDSPIYQNGELIDLPDIQTDSDDDDDDYPQKSDFHVPKWAESPELRGLLENQQSIDPEDVFGPMARLDMDAIFRDGGGRQKFRARTSSANWSGADRLTPDEIAADMEARRKMIEQGGWKYQPPQ